MDVHTGPTARYEDLAPSLRTGDLLLFHGKSQLGRMLELAGGSEFSHVGMIVRPAPDRPPLLWHAVPQAMTTDVLGDREHGGAQLNDLGEALARMTSPGHDDTPFVRQLTVERTPAMDEAALEAVRRVDQTPFPSVWRFAVDWVLGRLHVRTAGRHMDCAEVLARTYQRMGLLPPDPPPNAYTPRDFSARHMNLRLLRGAALGPEIEVRWSRPADAVSGRGRATLRTPG